MVNVLLRPRSQGYTLIELMIVVMVVAILVMASLLVYQGFVVRARVAEGLVMATPAKLLVLENLACGEHDFALGWSISPATAHVQSISVDGVSGAITVDFTDPAGGGDIILQPSIGGAPISESNSSGQVVWDCSGGSLSSLYRPADCR